MFGAAAQTIRKDPVCIQIGVEYGFIINAESFDDLQALRMFCCLAFSFLCGIPDEHIKDVTGRFTADEMSIIFDPSDLSPLLYDPVFHIIQIMAAFCNLAPDAFLDFFQVVRMYDSMKRVAGKTAEFIHGITVEDPEHGFVCIDDLLVFICMIDKESSRHLIHKIFYGKSGLQGRQNRIPAFRSIQCR